MNAAILSFPRSARCVDDCDSRRLEVSLRIVYAALDAYADRVGRTEHFSAERLHSLKDDARRALIAGESRSMAIAGAQSQDRRRHPKVRWPGDVA